MFREVRDAGAMGNGFLSHLDSKLIYGKPELLNQKTNIHLNNQVK